MSTSATADEATEWVADTLSRWAAAYSFEDIPDVVVEEAKRCLMDTTGVALAGSQHPTAMLARAQVETQYGEGPCNIFGCPDPAAPSGAAFANGVAAHALDYDDVSYEGMVHATAVVWPAVLAAAEPVSATGREILTAFVAAVELEYALGGVGLVWKIHVIDLVRFWCRDGRPKTAIRDNGPLQGRILSRRQGRAGEGGNAPHRQKRYDAVS